MQHYSNLVEAINDLTKQGYSYNLNTKGDCIECVENKIQLQPEPVCTFS